MNILRKVEWIKYDGTIEELNVSEGFWVKQRLDDRLDEAFIVIPSWWRQDEMDRFSKVKITIGNSTQYFLIDGSDITNLSANLSTFKHEVRLIELTKYHEKLFVGNKSFSRKRNGDSNYTILEAIEILFAITKERYNLNYLFTVNDDFKDKLNVDLPEIQMEDVNLREAINILLSILDLTYELLEDGSIVEVNFNKKNNNIGDDILDLNPNSFLKGTDGEYFGSGINSNISNILTNKEYNLFPTKSNRELIEKDTIQDYSIGTSFKSPDNSVMGETNFNFKLPQGLLVGQIKKVYLSGILPTFDPNSDNLPITLDITDYVFTKEEYDALPSSRDLESFTKQNTVYYSIDGDSIDGWTESWSVFGLKLTFQNLIKSILEINTDVAWDNTFGITLIYNAKIKSTDVKISKTKNTNALTSSISSNQSNSNVNAFSAGKKLLGQINRVGNTDYIITRRITDVNDIIELGDYINDLIVTEIETVVYQNVLVQKIILNDSFNKLSEFIGIESRRRQFEIPIQNILKRTIFKENFAIITFFDEDDYNEIKRETFLTSLGVNKLAQSIVGSLLNIDGIRAYNQDFLNINKDNIWEINASSNLSLFMGCVGISLGNSMSFIVSFQDNITALDSIGEINGQTANLPISYTDELGFINKTINFRFVSYAEELFSLGVLIRGFLKTENGLFEREIGIPGDIITIDYVNDLGDNFTTTYVLTLENIINPSVVFSSSDLAGIEKITRANGTEFINDGPYFTVKNFELNTFGGNILNEGVLEKDKIRTVQFNFPVIQSHLLRVKNILISSEINPYKDSAEHLDINYQINFVNGSKKKNILICDGLTLENAFINDIEQSTFPNLSTIHVSNIPATEYNKNTIKGTIVNAKPSSNVFTDGIITVYLNVTLRSRTIILTLNDINTIVIDNFNLEEISEFKIVLSNQRKGIIYDW